MDYVLRPVIDTIEQGGCQFRLVDADGILLAARAHAVELLHGASFPAPVRRVAFSVATDGPVHLLSADIVIDLPGGSAEELSPAMLGIVGPVGVLLARRAAAGDRLAIRIADGVDALAAQAYRRLGLTGPVAEPAAPADEIESDGLRVTVDHADVPSGGRRTTLRATVPSDEVSPEHLRAMATLVLQTLTGLIEEYGELPDALTGRVYVVSRLPIDRPTAEGTADADLDQVGGLSAVVAQFRQIAVSFRHPEAMARWGARRPQGILMYGPPGTGKTMLARALANEIGATFREIRTPEILDKWLGASERNIKRIFREARRYREPTVMLFDEFDSIISYAGEGGDAASQAVNAVAGIFKQEMNNLIEDNPNVIVVATTNFPHRVDDSLIRSGRFDVKISIPLPDEAGRAEILTKMIRQLIERHERPGFRMFADDVDPAGLARVGTRMTGADLKEALRRVQLAKAMQEAHTGAVPSPISQDDLARSIVELTNGAT